MLLRASREGHVPQVLRVLPPGHVGTGLTSDAATQGLNQLRAPSEQAGGRVRQPPLAAEEPRLPSA